MFAAMSDLSTFLKAVADDLPTIEHRSETFRVRIAAPDDRQKAISYMKQDQATAVEASDDDNDPLTLDQVASWVKHTTEGNDSAIRLFDLDSIKTQRDLRMALFRISYLSAYILAMSLLTDDGNPIERKLFFVVAKTISTTPKFKRKIEDALKSLEATEESPNV